LINLKTPKQKLAEWALQNRMRRNFEVKLANSLKREINRTASEVSTAYLISGRQSIGIYSRQHFARIKNLIFSHWKVVTDTFRSRILSQIRLLQETEKKEYEDEFDKQFESFLFTYGSEKVTNISSTTMANIQSAIDSAQVDGLDVYQTARRITELTAISSITRAVLIARTETHQAANYANFTSLDVVNIPETTKEWVAVNDARTRDDHSAANGQVVSKNGDFVVGGAVLRYPGDPLGPPQQVINCRCTFVVNVPEPDFGGFEDE
tara:strand:+ start:265 stop:1059 length:795 start_codon:yes stop_codon:yes gene_type:complete